jgi:hypothetical protein
MAGARAAIRAASLELWQNPSTADLLASVGKSQIEKRARISPFLDFLGDGGSKQSISDEEVAALQNWVIQTITEQIHSVKNPSITRRRDTALIAALCAAPAKGTPRKWPKNCPQNHGKRSASVGRGNRRTMLRYLLAFLACLERAAGQARPTAALPQISPMEPIKTSFPRAQRRSLGPSSLA